MLPLACPASSLGLVLLGFRVTEKKTQSFAKLQLCRSRAKYTQRFDLDFRSKASIQNSSPELNHQKASKILQKPHHVSIDHPRHAGISSYRISRSSSHLASHILFFGHLAPDVLVFVLFFDGVCRLHQQLQPDLRRLLRNVRWLHHSIIHRPRLPIDDRLAIKHHASIRDHLLLLDALRGQHELLQSDVRRMFPSVRQLHHSIVR